MGRFSKYINSDDMEFKPIAEKEVLINIENDFSDKDDIDLCSAIIRSVMKNDGRFVCENISDNTYKIKERNVVCGMKYVFKINIRRYEDYDCVNAELLYKCLFFDQRYLDDWLYNRFVRRK